MKPAPEHDRASASVRHEDGASVLVEGRSLAVGYHLGRGRELRLLEGADFELEQGELVCLLGPNGSGKSTLLRTIAGMQAPLAGRVALLGEDVRRRTPDWLARHLSVVLTEPVDAGALTARELVGLGRYPFTDWLGRLTTRDHERIDTSIAAVDAGAIADRQVRSLSDGERQRVLIARALAQEPRLVVLDEPTAYLDLPRRIETLGLLRRLVRENGVSVLLSTHHLDLALSHADRVWLLPSGGPLTIGAPEDVALSGALERTFVSPGGSGWSGRLIFDPGDGTFGLREEPATAAVAIEGDGLARRWIERALRRERLAAVERSTLAETSGGGGQSRPPVIASLQILDGGPAGEDAGQSSRYRLEVDGATVDCASIHELMRRLRASARSISDSREAGRT